MILVLGDISERMRYPKPFWATDFIDTPNPTLTDALVQEAERMLGFRLPTEYLDLLRIRNGGYTAGFVLPTAVATSWAADHVSVGELFGIGGIGQETPPQSVLMTPSMTREWGIPPRQVVLLGDGHWWITLDYRRSFTPRVSWIDVEIEEDIVLAPSFEAFIEALLPDTAVDQETFLIRAPQ